MITVEVKLYAFDELTDTAKEKAREWWRECESEEFGGHDDIYEFAETAAKLLGIEFSTHSVRLMSGKDRQDPNVFWSLHSQGSGASFKGTYSYRKGSAKAIKTEFPTDSELKRIASELALLQKQHGYKLGATIDAGHEAHEYSMSLDLECGVKECKACGKANPSACDELLELMRDFARWIHKGISDEYDYRMSDENVDDSIQANEYTFRENGKRSNG